MNRVQEEHTAPETPQTPVVVPQEQPLTTPTQETPKPVYTPQPERREITVSNTTNKQPVLQNKQSGLIKITKQPQKQIIHKTTE